MLRLCLIKYEWNSWLSVQRIEFKRNLHAWTNCFMNEILLIGSNEGVKIRFLLPDLFTTLFKLRLYLLCIRRDLNFLRLYLKKPFGAYNIDFVRLQEASRALRQHPQLYWEKIYKFKGIERIFETRVVVFYIWQQQKYQSLTSKVSFLLNFIWEHPVSQL